MNRLRAFIGRFLGSYCPDEWEERESRTDRAITRAQDARARSHEASTRVEEMLASYRTVDERLRRR